MNSEELVRFVKERTALKRHKADLERELRSASQALLNVGRALKEVSGQGSFQNTPAYILGEVNKAPNICSFEKISERLADLKQSTEKLVEMDRQAQQMDVE